MNDHPDASARRRRAVIASLGVLLFAFLTLAAWQLSVWRPGTSAFRQSGDGPFYYSGVVHAHSIYSDGSGDIDYLARTAARAGCDFLITSDHNTLAPRAAGEEGYRHGVLVLCDQEVSTPAGHLLILDCPREIKAAEFENLQALLDTVRGTGGMVFLSHPFLKNRPWTDWGLTGINGFELLNADVEWRDDSPFEILRALILGRPFPQAVFNSLIDRPREELALLDRYPFPDRPVVIAAADAHARVRLTASKIIRYPSYESMFRLVRTVIVTPQPLSGRFQTDRRLIYEAIENGRCYAAWAGLGDPRGLEFRAVLDSTTVPMGGSLPLGTAPLIIEAALAAVGPDAPAEPVLMELYRDGRLVAASESSRLSHRADRPGLYRLEVCKRRKGLFGLYSKKLPWLFSNPIFITPG